MSALTLVNCRALVGTALKQCNIKIVDGKIRGILPPGDAYGKTYDAKNRIFLPGLIDIHTHGAVGYSFATATAEEVCKVRDFFASSGVTTFLPTIRANDTSTMLQSMNAISQAKNSYGCTQIYGINLEGPFINPVYAGNMSADHCMKCSYAIFKALQDESGGNVRMITISPEIDGAQELIRKLVLEGVRVSIGHSGADYETAAAAIESGAKCGTHIYHSMKLMRPAAPAITTALLESDVFCEYIYNPAVIHPAVMRLLIKTKGEKRIIGITNSDVDCGVENLTEDENIKHNTLTALETVKSMIKSGELTLNQAIGFFTENPAKLLGIYHYKGSIDVGKDADMMMLDDELNLLGTFSCGELVYAANNATRGAL